MRSIKVRDVAEILDGCGRAFHVVNLGCKVNRVESDDFAARLLSQGASCVPLSEASLIIVNTCTVTGEAEKKTRKAVRQALRANDSARVVVTGCAAAIDPDTYASMSERVSVVPKGRLTSLFDEAVAASESLRVGAEFPTRVGVKVQDGCNNACTYCIVHVARGKAWSRPLPDIVEEVRMLVGAGAREVVLTGINLGSYRFEGATLAGLLKNLLEATPNTVRFRVSSVEPRDVDDALIDLMARSNGRICRHLHLPLQSGSSRVLKEMARPYKADYFENLVAKLRAAIPSLSLSTDIIVGFPGETEEDFQATYDLVERVGYSQVFTFIYSRREGTPAASMQDDTPHEVIQRRFDSLVDLVQENAFAQNQRFVGRTVDVLVEGASKRDERVLAGHSPHNITVHAPLPEGVRIDDIVGTVVPVRIDAAKAWYLSGAMLRD